MRSSRTSWQAKLDRVQEPKVVDGTARNPGTMLIPTPRQIEALIREIPLGAVSTPKLIRATLAQRSGADTTCPLCTGIFIRIAAEAAAEQGGDTPYWRVVDAKGRHNPKLPGGAEGQARLLEAEVATILGSAA